MMCVAEEIGFDYDGERNEFMPHLFRFHDEMAGSYSDITVEAPPDSYSVGKEYRIRFQEYQPHTPKPQYRRRFISAEVSDE